MPLAPCLQALHSCQEIFATSTRQFIHNFWECLAVDQFHIVFLEHSETIGALRGVWVGNCCTYSTSTGKCTKYSGQLTTSCKTNSNLAPNNGSESTGLSKWTETTSFLNEEPPFCSTKRLKEKKYPAKAKRP